MRKDLELIETIDKYINGNLSETDKAAFEKKLQNDPALQKEVQLQKELMQGIQRAGIKQSAKLGLKKYKFSRNLKNWGLTGLTIAVVAASAMVVYTKAINKTPTENAANELPALNEQGEKLWSDADKYLPLQSFELNNEKDTVIETQDGIVFAIPANAFLDASGKPVKGAIRLEVKEALKAADIMKAGLNTKSGDKLLETGGMFYLNARQNDVSLKIDPKNEIYAQIPANEVKPGMQLFEGKRLPNGSIDWINPKPIVKDLIPRDIFSLNFYPPDYLDSLRKWGYDAKDKKFTDSLYYSFAAYFPDEDALRIKAHEDSIAAVNAAIAAEIAARKNLNAAEMMKKYSFHYDTESNIVYSYSDSLNWHGINPAKIKAIWSDKFQNTLLATKEFEERLPYIHRTCEEYVLDMYINNLDKNLSTIDSMVANTGMYGEAGMREVANAHPEFLQFAMRGDGKVKNGNKNVELLKAYYKEKTKLFTDAIAKTVNAFRDKQKELNNAATEKRTEQQNKDVARNADNFKKELGLNLDEAYRQLGRKRPAATPGNPYGLHIATTGWYNVDKYVIESTQTRTTLDYTDPVNGRKAVIKYNAFSVSVTDYKNYDRVLVYLIPDKLNSFMRVDSKNGNELFEEKLNELMTYKMVCIAYKGEESFYFAQDDVQPKAYSVSLIKTTNNIIRDNVNKLTNMSQVKAMNDELNYMDFEKGEVKRQAELVKINELTMKAGHVIFPCLAPAAPKADTTDGPSEK